MITAIGTSGTVTLDKGMITITHPTVWARFFGNIKALAIPIRQLTSVHMVKAGHGRIGYIEFVYGGSKRRVIRTGTCRQNAKRDENSVTFKRSQAAQFTTLCAEVRNEMLQAGQA